MSAPAGLPDIARRLDGMTAAIVALRAEVAALRIAQPQALVPPLPRDVAELLARLLPAVYARWPGEVFTAGELLALAVDDADMRRALGGWALGSGDLAKRLGRALSGCAGVVSGGLVLEVYRSRSPLLFAAHVAEGLKPAQTHETRAGQ